VMQASYSIVARTRRGAVVVKQIFWLLCFLWAWLCRSSVALPIVSRVDVPEPGAGAFVPIGHGWPGAAHGSIGRVSLHDVIRRERIDHVHRHGRIVLHRELRRPAATNVAVLRRSGCDFEENVETVSA